jgi:hypothetical protein
MRFKKFFPFLIFVLAVFMFPSVPAVYSQGKVKTVSTKEKTTTIKGEVIGLNCYLSEGSNATGEKHKACALSCAKAGGMLAILTSDGTIYVPVVSMGTNPDTQLMDYVADQVEITGKVDDRGNMKGIEISSIKKAK